MTRALKVSGGGYGRAGGGVGQRRYDKETPVQHGSGCGASVTRLLMALTTTGVLLHVTSGIAVTARCCAATRSAPSLQETAPGGVQAPQESDAALELDRESRRQVQQRLREAGFDPGPADGQLGPRTRDAIRRWQESAGVPATGYLDSAGVEMLLGATDEPAAGPSAVSEGATDSASLAAEQSASPIPAAVVPDEVDVASERDPVSAQPPPTARPPGPFQLPPEILVDRHLVRVERLLAAGNHAEAHAVMQQIVALQEEHAVTLPDDFAFRSAQVAFGAGLTETAIGSLNEYLLTVGREGALYREALELLDSAEERLRREEAERRRADARRRRQQEVDTFIQRQREAATLAVPRDSLQSGGLAPELVRMATGRFQYGRRLRTRRPVWVSIESPFAISKYEVSRGDFARFAETTGYRTEAERSEDDSTCEYPVGLERDRPGRTWRRPGFTQTDAHPVVCVTIRDAMAYAQWLSQETGHRYRLPSAAEWQYAARAGSEEAMLYIRRTDRNYCGRGNLGEYPRSAGISCTDGIERTEAVGRFPPNGVGLHDMIGNVTEWILACAHDVPNSDNLVAPRPDGAQEDPRTCEHHLAYGPGFRHGADAGYATLSGSGLWPTHSTRGFRVLREPDEDHASSL